MLAGGGHVAPGDVFVLADAFLKLQRTVEKKPLGFRHFELGFDLRCRFRCCLEQRQRLFEFIADDLQLLPGGLRYFPFTQHVELCGSLRKHALAAGDINELAGRPAGEFLKFDRGAMGDFENIFA